MDLAALILGIFLNASTIGGISWSIGSVVAVVIMGIYIKTSQDMHFEELKSLLKKRFRRITQTIRQMMLVCIQPNNFPFIRRPPFPARFGK